VWCIGSMLALGARGTGFNSLHPDQINFLLNIQFIYMAKSVKYKYNPNATATCSNCKSVYTFGMTVDTLALEICGNCHPFYTGQDTVVDTAGRIEKFQARLAKVASENQDKMIKTKARKTKQSLADLN
jgi:large subunit ribosomal protein L31